MSEILVRVPIEAPVPLMHRDAAEAILECREVVKRESGHDFLGKCGDIFRHANFVSSKDGVVNRSWHKTGRAVDVDQSHPALVIVSEPVGGKQYFRLYLKCAKQDGSLGKNLTVRDKRGYKVSGYLFDLTTAFEAFGFKRIPAWSGWQSHYNRQEFWHYQCDQNLTWAEAMAQLRGTAPDANKGAIGVIGRNDRGKSVRLAQQKLFKLGLLPQSEVDGVFGAKTHAAVLMFQQKNKLDADGLIGKETRALLEAQTK